MEFKRVSFDKYGGPLTITSLKISEQLKEHHVLIKVFSVSLNPIDYKRREGKLKLISKDTFPSGICFDVSGIVERIGSEVKTVNVGQRVCARSKESNTLAEFCIVDESVVAPIPDNVSFDAAAALPLAGQTALQALRFAKLKEGEKVLISGGAGGVGTYAIQLAKHIFKASRVVVTCSGSKIEFCKSLGADECIDYTKGDPFKPELGEFDVVFDTTGEAAKMGGKLIKPGRILVSVGSLPDPESFDRAGRSIPFFVRAFLKIATLKTRWATAPGIYQYMWLIANTKDLSELLSYLSDGRVISQIDSTFVGLEQSTEAFAKLETGRAKGKVIIKVRN